MSKSMDWEKEFYREFVTNDGFVGSGITDAEDVVSFIEQTIDKQCLKEKQELIEEIKEKLNMYSRVDDDSGAVYFENIWIANGKVENAYDLFIDYLDSLNQSEKGSDSNK